MLFLKTECVSSLDKVQTANLILMLCTFVRHPQCCTHAHTALLFQAFGNIILYFHNVLPSFLPN